METKKIIIVGDSRVGKTALVRRINGLDLIAYAPTLGVEVSSVERGTPPYRLDLWDRAGGLPHQDLDEGFYAGANIAIIVYDNNAVTSTIDYDAFVRQKYGSRVCGANPTGKGTPSVPSRTEGDIEDPQHPSIWIIECVNHFENCVPSDPPRRILEDHNLEEIDDAPIDKARFHVNLATGEGVEELLDFTEDLDI